MSGASASLKRTSTVFLGDQSVGKTSVITRFVYDTFDTTYHATTVVECVNKNIDLDDRTVPLKLQDTSGQEHFHPLTSTYIRDSSVAIVVYDITDRASYMSINKWISQARSEMGPDVMIVLIGNKADLSDNRQVPFEEATQRANELDIIFMETSAKAGHNVQAVFKKIAICLPCTQELSAAGDQLRSALDRYGRACSSARNACLGGGRLNGATEILASLKKESTDITSHIQRLEDARAAIHAARSSIPKVVPITALPAEIVTRIFQFVVPGQLCLVRRSSEAKAWQVKYPLYPDNLAHVCSFWRRIAIGTPSLWTHIDIVLDHSLNPGSFARAKVYAVRAGQLPLEIHISDPGSKRERKRGRTAPDSASEDPSHDPNYEWEDLHEFKVLPSDAVPIKTLELDLRIRSQYREIYYSVIEYFFARSKLGVLAQYIVRGSGNEWTEPNPFIEPVDTPHSLDGALLAVPSAHLEELWLHTSILRVSGLCPHWKSKAYHGLVELYIDQGIPEISESQLVNLLRSSPKLQVFHIKAVVGGFINGANMQPIYLGDLRDLNVMIEFDEELCVPHVLRWIAPGPIPLQFAYLGTPGDSLVDLFSRGNVTRFYIRPTQEDLFSLLRVLRKAPRIETLVLDGLYPGIMSLTSLLDIDAGDDDDDDSDGEVEIALERVSPSTTQIHTLHLLRFARFRFEAVQAVVKQYSVQRLVIHGGKLTYQADDGRVVSDNLRNTRIKLSSITACPTIEYYPDIQLTTRDCDEWITTSLLS